MGPSQVCQASSHLQVGTLASQATDQQVTAMFPGSSTACHSLWLRPVSQGCPLHVLAGGWTAGRRPRSPPGSLALQELRQPRTYQLPNLLGTWRATRLAKGLSPLLLLPWRPGAWSCSQEIWATTLWIPGILLSLGREAKVHTPAAGQGWGMHGTAAWCPGGARMPREWGVGNGCLGPCYVACRPPWHCCTSCLTPAA